MLNRSQYRCSPYLAKAARRDEWTAPPNSHSYGSTSTPAAGLATATPAIARWVASSLRR